MKRLICVVLSVLISMMVFSSLAVAKEITVNFSWDADTSGGWEVLSLFQREEGTSYNYDTPDANIPQSYDETTGESKPITFKHLTTVPDGVKTQLYWILRSNANCVDVNDSTTCDLSSADSEEVGLLIDLTPLVAPAYTAVYNQVSKSIDFSWEVTDTRVNSWKIFTKLPSETEYTELAQVDASGSTSIPIGDLFPEREKTTREFTMVAYGDWDLFSPDSTTTTITLNRIPPSGVINFKIILN